MTVAEVNDSTINVTINNTAENEKKIATAKIEELINEEDKIILEDLAPDGGWGWMIALARILIMVSIILMRDKYNSVIETYISLFTPTNNIGLKIILEIFPIQT